MCLKLQLVQLNRIGELLPTAEDYYLRAKDVRFVICTDDAALDIQIQPNAAYKYRKQQLKAVLTNIRAAKNDTERKGHRLYFEVQSISTETAEFCLATDMFTWASLARPTGTEAFLSWKNTWTLDYQYCNNKIKETATKMGFDANRFSTHSVRIAGASALAAAGAQTMSSKHGGGSSIPGKQSPPTA
jgi:hypothetical protein